MAPASNASQNQQQGRRVSAASVRQSANHGPRFVRFSELDVALVNRDLQIHTVSSDGEATIAQVLEQAHRLRLGEIAFTEHVRRTSDYFSRFAADVRAARHGSSVRVFVGLEAKAADASGMLDAPIEALAEAELVLGSVHRFPMDDGAFLAAENFSYEDAWGREFALSLALLEQAPIHVLAHPGGMCQRAFGRFPDAQMRMLMRTALQRGVAIEINSKYTRDLDAFLALCREINPIVSIGSDAHRLEDLGTCRDALRARGIGVR